MKKRLRLKQALGVLALGLFGNLLGCGHTKPDGQVGGETHWLDSCETSQDCGGKLGCYCGRCSVTCSSEAVCAGLSDTARCVATGQISFASTCDTPVQSLCVRASDVSGGQQAADTDAATMSSAEPSESVVTSGASSSAEPSESVVTSGASTGGVVPSASTGASVLQSVDSGLPSTVRPEIDAGGSQQVPDKGEPIKRIADGTYSLNLPIIAQYDPPSPSRFYAQGWELNLELTLSAGVVSAWISGASILYDVGPSFTPTRSVAMIGQVVGEDTIQFEPVVLNFLSLAEEPLGRSELELNDFKLVWNSAGAVEFQTVGVWVSGQESAPILQFSASAAASPDTVVPQSQLSGSVNPLDNLRVVFSEPVKQPDALALGVQSGGNAVTHLTAWIADARPGFVNGFVLQPNQVWPEGDLSLMGMAIDAAGNSGPLQFTQNILSVPALSPDLGFESSAGWYFSNVETPESYPLAASETVTAPQGQRFAQMPPGSVAMARVQASAGDSQLCFQVGSFAQYRFPWAPSLKVTLASDTERVDRVWDVRLLALTRPDWTEMSELCVPLPAGSTQGMLLRFLAVREGLILPPPPSIGRTAVLIDGLTLK